MHSLKMAAAEALNPLLSQFDKISGQLLRDVWQQTDDGSVSQIILDFGDDVLVLYVDADTDTIEADVRKAVKVDRSGALSVGANEPWRDYAALPFGWAWVTINSQGYMDGVMMSFGGIVPAIAVNVAASSINIYRMARSG